jgi:hypothetical protein
MNYYTNVPDSQQFTRHIVDIFNRDEMLWKKLEKSRKRRRKKMNISEERHRLLDILEFEAKRPPDDCIGRKIGNTEIASNHDLPL